MVKAPSQEPLSYNIPQKKGLLSEEILGIRKPRARSLLDVNEELSVEYNVKFTA